MDLFDTSIAGEAPSHTEIQWLLAKLGSDMGLGVWVAKNDRKRAFRGAYFSELAGLVPALPVQFDASTARTVELIDVLWLEGQSIRAAFEIIITSTVHSGLLRMADLVAMQPNLSIPLYLVAPEARRDKVLAEIARPSFAGLRPPLPEICRYIPFDALRDNVARVAPFLRHLAPGFLDDVAETCVPG